MEETTHDDTQGNEIPKHEKRTIEVGTKIVYKGIIATVYRVNKTIGFLGKSTYDLEINNLKDGDIDQIIT